MNAYIRLILALLCLSLFITGCSKSATPPAIPTAKSPVIHEFLWQRDGDYAYAMLRPAGWQSADSGAGRDYFPNPQDDRMRLVLTAINLKVYSDNLHAGSDVRWDLYQQHPQLDAWVNAVIQTIWKNDTVQLEASLDRARIYSVRSQAGHIRLVGYVIDQGVPLEIMLQVGGEQALMEQVQQTGLMEDFIKIVESARLEPVQPGFSNPKLNGRP